ncbi:kinesin-like protein KIN-14R [Ziziphus jujuba]|uniref:Kinesin-like protein n=1 Tax=Ziziphus jujuba TaxID=326968 RepID=A0ABM3ILB6_ZIZJJ|nr:kinesin-like protein KIN-14R [Ziziphus jujuba]
MAETNSTNTHCQSAQTLLNPISWSNNNVIIGPDNNDDADSADLALCVPGSRLVRTGFVHSTSSAGNTMLLVNAGGEAPMERRDLDIQVLNDRFFHGGDVLRTDENIAEGGSMPWIYQSARFGNFSYRFENIPPGEYLVDLHFAEIIYTNGPKGMRLFDVFMQEEKVLSELDIYSVVGANKALQLVDARVSVGGDGAIVIRFEGVNGSPIVSGICIKQSADFPDQVIGKREAEFRDLSSRYEHDKRQWNAVIEKLERQVKTMKQEHTLLSYEARKCADSIPELDKMVSAVQALVAQCDDLKLKFSVEQAKRKKLYNQIQEAKGNIRVFCRCRPMRKDELSARHATVVDFDAAQDGELGILTGGATKKIFRFDRVYTPKDNQVDVFADASPVVVSVLDGYNVCIFAYGQTGTGKTFTMEGPEQNRGVNYRTLEHLFKIAEERRETFIYDISVSVLEVYNEQIRDLLASSPASKKLEIRQASEGVHHVPGIVEAKAENISEVWSVLQAGSNARATGSNNVNEHSSRSHCMLCIMVRAKNLMNGECTKSKLWLVDLAGSERLAKTEVQSDRLKEAQNINRSLSALGDVISALATKNNHIPYRNSKLTHLLQDSLGGDSKTLMFVQISPSEQDLSETLSSLNFATRVRGVELGPARKQSDMGEVQKIKSMLDKVKQELRSKEDALCKLEETLHYLESKGKSKDQLFRTQQEKFIELQDQLDSKTKLCRQLEKQLLELSEETKGKEEICSSLQRKVKELENKLIEHGYAESMLLQKKAMQVEHENNLKERAQEFEHQSVILKQKVKELENKLKMKEEANEIHFLQKKVRELEGKLRQQEKEGEPLTFSVENLGATPCETRSWLRAETPLSTKRLNSSNQVMNQESDLLKGTDSLRELRRRREWQSKGIENNILLSKTPLPDRKILSTDSKIVKPVDPSRALARITRNTKPSSTASRVISNNKSYRDQVPGIKSKIWLR